MNFQHVCFDISFPTCYVRPQLASAGTWYYPKCWHTGCGDPRRVVQDHWHTFCLQQQWKFKCCIFTSSFTTEHIGLFFSDKKKAVSNICKWFKYPTSFLYSVEYIVVSHIRSNEAKESTSVIYVAVTADVPPCRVKQTCCNNLNFTVVQSLYSFIFFLSSTKIWWLPSLISINSLQLSIARVHRSARTGEEQRDVILPLRG